MYTDNEFNNKKNSLFGNLFRKRTKRLFNDFEKKFNQVVNVKMIIQIICIITGLCLFLLTGLSDTVVAYVVAVYVIVWSINSLSASRSQEYNLFKRFLIYAILGIITAVALIITKNVPLCLGLWILIEMLVKLDFMFQFKKISLSSWTVLLGYSIFLLMFAILIFVNPLKQLLLTEFTGVMLILTSILNLTALNLVKTIGVDYLNDF